MIGYATSMMRTDIAANKSLYKSCSQSSSSFPFLHSIQKLSKSFQSNNIQEASLSLAMIVPSCLALWSIFAWCPFVRALTLNLYNNTSPNLASQNSGDFAAGISPNLHCTKDPNWLVPTYPNILSYDFMCQTALAHAVRELSSHGLDTEFEFLDRGSSAQTTKPQIQLPRKYVASKYCNIGKHI